MNDNRTATQKPARTTLWVVVERCGHRPASDTRTKTPTTQTGYHSSGQIISKAITNRLRRTLLSSSAVTVGLSVDVCRLFFRINMKPIISPLPGSYQHGTALLAAPLLARQKGRNRAPCRILTVQYTVQIKSVAFQFFASQSGNLSRPISSS